jgi:hypothetical protein
MRINEIISESLEEDSLDEWTDTDRGIIDVLKKKGYKYLGAGVDQTAFIEPGTGFVLKIFGTQGKKGFGPDHKMFFAWADFCSKHQDNPYLPRIYAHESFLWQDPETKKHHRYLMIRTEQLYDSGKIGVTLEDLARGFSYGDDYDAGIDRFRFFTKDDKQKQILKLLGKKGFDRMAKTIYDLAKIADKKGWGLDLHGGNFMLRKNGTPVINDPWVVSN